VDNFPPGFQNGLTKRKREKAPKREKENKKQTKKKECVRSLPILYLRFNNKSEALMTFVFLFFCFSFSLFVFPGLDKVRKLVLQCNRFERNFKELKKWQKFYLALQ
jgi:hypothetical protein